MKSLIHLVYYWFLPMWIFSHGGFWMLAAILFCAVPIDETIKLSKRKSSDG